MLGFARICASLNERRYLRYKNTMGFAVWIDQASGVVWAQGTHEYRPMGAAVIAVTDQFRTRDFGPSRRCPARLRRSFAGFFGSLEEVNASLRSRRRWRLRSTPSHLW